MKFSFEYFKSSAGSISNFTAFPVLSFIAISLTIVNERTGLEVAAVNDKIFCSMLRIERFQSHDPTTSKFKRETMRGASKRCFRCSIYGRKQSF